MSAINAQLSILAVEDNPGDIFLLKEFLRATDLSIGTIFEAGRLSEAKKILGEEKIDLVFLDLPRRVAKGLLSQPRGDDGVIGQKMTQEELAHRVGGARQSVNAALRGFERRGWIQVRNQAVTVRQAAALSRFAGD